MKIVNVHEAKTHLSRLIKAALEGEEIIIARGNVPVVRLQCLESAKLRRRVGFIDTEVVMSDDFDEPLDDFGEYS